MDWDFDGVEFDEEAKLRDETRKILELPELPLSATCVRVPVLVGHAEAVWVETEEAARPPRRPSVSSPPRPACASRTSRRTGQAIGTRRRRSSAASAATRRPRTASSLFLACDNLRKGAALNAIQIAELVVGATAAA